MKRSDSLYIGLIFVAFTISIAGWALLSPFVEAEETSEPLMEATPQHRYTVTGERYTVSPEQFTRLCPGTDCIPALSADQTQYITTAEADDWLESSDRVISVTVDGETVAYPVTVMQHHAIANTVIGGEPVVVTYAPHAGYATAFSRQVQTGAGIKELSFVFTGSLLHGDIVMQDTLTDTRWSPYHGTGIVGELAATSLQRIDTDVVRWSLWQEQHPNGSVLSHDTGVFEEERYADDPYFPYRSATDVPGTAPDLDGLHPKDTVYGVTVNGEAAAYRAVHIKDFEMVEDVVRDQPILLIQNEDTGTVRAFERQVGGDTLSFDWDGTGTMQSRDGTTWTPYGHAVDGPLTGKQLDTVPLTRMYWFTWKQFNPSTRLYEP